MRPEMVGAMNFTIYVPLTCRDGNNECFQEKLLKLLTNDAQQAKTNDNGSSE